VAERQNRVYDNVLTEGNRLFNMSLGNRPHIMIVIITPFGLYGAGQHLQNQRILHNFEEALLQAYASLKVSCDSLFVVTIPIHDAQSGD
jgi:hypothetical protein